MDLSIVIVEYRCLDHVQQCLNSIYRYIHGINYEIKISSNSCYDEAMQRKLHYEFDNVEWIFNKKNVGYARGVNSGIEQCKGNCIFVFNPDIQLLDKEITHALKYLERNTDIGIIGPKITDSNSRIQDSCRSFITPYAFAARCITRFSRKIDSEILDERNYGETRNVDWVSGACMLVKRNAISKVGLMDGRYFMYIEDMDWCKRFWDSGFRVVYWPKMKVHHNPSRASSVALAKIRPNKLMWIHFISYLKFFWKYFPRSLYFNNKK